MTKPFVIGVTGGIATGKSAVLAILGEHGFETIDTDLIYHHLIQPGGPLVAPLVQVFGRTVQEAGGSIDRRALGSIVFSNPAKLAELDRITHPAVVAAVRERIDGSPNDRLAVDAVKLIESGMSELCDSVWLVVADPEIQRGRLMARNNISREEADRRLAAQPDETDRRLRADHIIENSGSLTELRSAVALTLAKSLPKV